jgi:hypothetical protein
MILGQSIECLVVHALFDHVSRRLRGFDDNEKNNDRTDDLAQAGDPPAPGARDIQADDFVALELINDVCARYLLHMMALTNEPT